MKKLAIAMMMLGGVAVAPALADTCSNGQIISNKTFYRLEVLPGTCILDHVTVQGGLTVDGGAHLQLSNATINGGINVQPGGKLDLQGGGKLVLGSSTINGGIVFNNASDFHLRNSVVNGGVSIAGPGNGGFSPTVCDLTIRGGVTATNANQYFGFDIGATLFGLSCSGNKIDGSVTVDNSVVGFLFNNVINGSLVCINRGVVSSNGGNTIAGSNTCF
jgi:hypothetical protein